MMIYNGYECYRNRLTGRFYALPIGDDQKARQAPGFRHGEG